MKKLYILLYILFSFSSLRAQETVNRLLGIHMVEGRSVSDGTFNVSGISQTSNGNLYIADNFFGLIRYITPDSIIRTFRKAAFADSRLYNMNELIVDDDLTTWIGTRNPGRVFRYQRM